MADKATLSQEETREVIQIRADIAQTRAELSDTIGAIQEKLNPTRLREQAVDTVREATIGRVEHMAGRIGDRMNDTRRGVMGFVSDNPVPLALLGIGAGWLAMSRRNKGSRGREARFRAVEVERETYPLGYESATFYGANVGPTTEREYYEGRMGEGGRMGGRMQQARDRLSEKTSELSDRFSSRASEASDRVRERTDDLRHRASELGSTVSDRAHTVADRTRSIAHDTGERARELTRTASQRYEENPFFGGMVALALGAAAGMLLPVSDREAEVIGPRRDELLSRAREMGRDKIERVRHVAEEVASDTRECVQRSVKEHSKEEGFMASGRGEGAMGESGQGGVGRGESQGSTYGSGEQFGGSSR